jgi:putative heme-binding domain-containing protein
MLPELTCDIFVFRLVVPMKRDRSRLHFLAIGFVWTMALVLGAGSRLRAQGGPPKYPPTDIQYGSRIYAAQCSVCHGATGDTIAGVNLRTGPIRRATTDNELRNLITTGITGTAMPSFKFTPSELTMIVAYVRNMRDFDARSVAIGDADRGRTVFEGSGKCTTCHRVNGKGPRVAPDLSDIGAVRSADALQRSVVDPNGNIVPANRYVRAVTRDGKTITGHRLNEDTYTVQLIDEQEHLVSLTKADLREYTVIMTSPMPAYASTLRAEEVADVVAYLVSLKGLP